MNRVSTRLRNILVSDSFFYATIILFILGSSWVALASLYPMAFDEDFHMGFIKIYATSWLPYGIEHTRDMAEFGSATADPSYLWQYLLSFPYRFFAAISIPFDTTVVLLRLMNLGLFIGALLIFRRGLIEAGISKTIVHVTLALFTLIPVTPMLAGQVNYDNPLLLLVALTLLLVVRITNQIIRTGELHIVSLWLFIIVALFGVATKYAYVPMLIGFTIWLVYIIVAARSKISLKSQWNSFYRTTVRLRNKTKLIIASGILLGSFFAAHYIVNLVQYGSFIPDCEEVFDESACLQYGPWRRDFELKASKPDNFIPVTFPAYIVQHWVPDMGQRLTFAVAGSTNDFQTKKPLQPLYLIFMTLGLIGILILILSAWFLRSMPIIWITLLVCICYLVPLTIKLYEAYQITAQPVAINGRYLLPVLPLVAVSILLALHQLVRRIGFTHLSIYAATILLVCLVLLGGGVGTYIIQSEPHWFFNGWAQESHRLLQNIFSAFVIRFN